MPPENDQGSQAPPNEPAKGANSEPSSSSTPGEPGAGGAQPGEQTSSDDGDGQQPKPKRKARGGFQQRIDELTRQNREKDATIERLLTLAEGRSGNGAAGGDDPEPDREKFEDYEQYLDARSDWRARQEFKRLQSEQAEKAEQDRAQQSAAEIDREYRVREAAARAKYDDFDEVVYESGTPFSTPMANAIKASDVGPEIAYYLGENPEEATRIYALEPMKAVIAIGRIEAQLSGEQSGEGSRSNAPPPTGPPPSGGGGGGTPNALSDKLSTEEWMKRRRDEVNKLRHRA